MASADAPPTSGGTCVRCHRVPPAHWGIGFVRDEGMVCQSCATCGLCHPSKSHLHGRHVHYVPEIQLYCHDVHELCFKCNRLVIRWEKSGYEHCVLPGTITVGITDTEIVARELLCTLCSRPCGSKCCSRPHRPMNGKKEDYISMEPNGEWRHPGCAPFHGD